MIATEPTSKQGLSRNEIIGLAILLTGHLLAAYHSFGFHHPDEHFQILEFAHAYLGLSDTAHLPWEYSAQIRPWFQPFLHALVMKGALLVHAYNAFHLAFLFRAIYGLLNIWALFALWRSFRERFRIADIWWPLISATWFFPYLHVRTSSENLSGIFLAFAFLQLWKPRALFFRAGLLFGFAFLARYQIALGLIGLAAVLLIQARKITLDHWRLAAGFVLPVGLGIVLDRIGYGNWVFTAYRYFTVNLVQGVAATFNPYPWYQYFIWIAQLNPAVSLPLFAGFVLYLKKYKLDVLSGFTLAFFFLHLFITNKEYRFLFPILNFVPFMTAVVWDKQAARLARPLFWIGYATISILAFTASAMRGASIHTLWPSETYNNHAEPGDHWISNRNFVNLAQTAYYTLTGLDLAVVHSADELRTAIRRFDETKLIIDGKLEDEVTVEFMRVAEDEHCRIEETAYPLWLYSWKQTFPIMSRLTFKAYYVCNRSNSFKASSNTLKAASIGFESRKSTPALIKVSSGS